MQCSELRFFNPLAEIAKTRNHLPHWQQPGATYFITFRLADAVPAGLRSTWLAERSAWMAHHPEPWSAGVEKEYHQRFSAQVDEWLDAGHGECVLRDDACREVVEAALPSRDGDEYLHHAWVVMPNHAHALVSLRTGAVLEKVVGAWKIVSSHQRADRSARDAVAGGLFRPADPGCGAFRECRALHPAEPGEG